MRDILRYTGDPREHGKSGTHELRADGHRFKIKLVHASQPLEGNWSYPAYANLTAEGLGNGRVLPPSEMSTYQTPADFFSITTLVIQDKHQKNRSTDVLGLLPAGWLAEAVALKPEINEVLRKTGVVENATGRYGIGKLLPIVPFVDTHRVEIPVYKLGQEKLGIDTAAEQIIYTVGLAQATPTDEAASFQHAHASARTFLQETLGGRLLLLGTR